MLCKTCRYSLKNLTEHRCPECGRAFDPKDPGTYFKLPPEIVTRSVMYHIAIACYVLNLAVLVYFAFTKMPHDLFGAIFVAPLAAAGLLIITFPIGIVLYGMYWIVRRQFRSTE